jgi:Tetratricopeptide repeat
MPSLVFCRSLRAIAILLAFFLNLAIQIQAHPAQTLNIGIPISKVVCPSELTPANIKSSNQGDFYEFNGTKGEYVEVRSEQQGCDIRLRLFEPQGKVVATVDSYNGAFGPEQWRGVLGQSGNYQIQVEMLSAWGDKAKYNITLTTKRQPSNVDLKRAQAQALYCQAMLRRQAGQQRDAEEAYYIYEEAAKLYREANDVLGEAQTVESEAALGTPVLTVSLRITLYRNALALYRRMREMNGEAMALHNLGMIHLENNKINDALPLYQQALMIHRMMGNQHGEALALNHLGSVYIALDLPQEALQYYKQALGICRKLEDRRGEAYMLRYIGDVYEQLGQANEATRYRRQSEMVEQECNNK